MLKKSFSLLLVVVMVLLAVPSVNAQDPLGSEGNPIQVYFVPSTEAQTIIDGGNVLAQALKEATGYNFEVYVPTSYAATIEAMCAAPDKSIGFIPAAAYVIASNRCGVTVGAEAVRGGWNVYWAEYIVRRDSPIYTFGDLAGKTWGYGDPGSTSGYIVPATEMKAAGIVPGKEVETGGHTQTVLAVYNGEVDFGTVFFSAPVTPGAAWSIGDLPEPYDLTVDQSHVGTDGELYVGDIKVMDARRNVRDTNPDVVDQVRILRLSGAVPNDTLSFGASFPEDARQKILDALFALAGNADAWNATALKTAYSWTGIVPVDDAAYDPVRDWFDVLGLSQEDFYK